MSRYWKGSQTTHRLMYHLVWVPKYRKRVLKGVVAQRLAELIQECADLQRWKIEELNISNLDFFLEINEKIKGVCLYYEENGNQIELL